MAPDIALGTAEEDAFRRDAIVDALFFNVDTRQVLDLTGKGLQEMASRVIRTLFEPQQTFLDDPLRVLRLIRISSKSISRRRRRCEISESAKRWKQKIGNPQDDAFHLILEAGLYTRVFLKSQFNPILVKELKDKLSTQNGEHLWPNTWQLAYQTFHSLINQHET
ncbi:hypothetical protein GGS21DRAFT_490518 [Xylaria nigripes]|nr:hypothetical protein GGS21DRAFT_490518 [Xylaria nigripes]